MQAGKDRRYFMGLALSGALAGVFGRPLAAATATAGVTLLGARLALLQGYGGNVTLLTGPGGPLLVDGGSAAHTAALLSAVTAHSSSKQVPVLINSHWHPEQTGANEQLGRAGARIIAHENTRLWLSNDFESPWQKRHYTPLPREALPNDTFYTTGSLLHGGERVDYGYVLQAHTDSDIWVFFRDSNVLVASDLLAVASYPILDYVTLGWIGGMVNANKALLELANADTCIVPGIGPVQTREDLKRQLDMLLVLQERLYNLLRDGRSAEEMLAAHPTREYDARCGDPELFIRNAFRGMTAHVRQIPIIV
jgi:glyoxylase-like metal-dependent hydrolase (beta-lactamase superfamily II)